MHKEQHPEKYKRGLAYDCWDDIPACEKGATCNICRQGRPVGRKLRPSTEPKAPMRKFETGATRDTDKDKADYEGFLSPLVIEEFGRYMLTHQVQADGKLRASDNWQKGIPLDVYIKSMWRHFLDLWKWHRGFPSRESFKAALCGILFNVMGYLHTILADELEAAADEEWLDTDDWGDWYSKGPSVQDLGDIEEEEWQSLMRKAEALMKEAEAQCK